MTKMLDYFLALFLLLGIQETSGVPEVPKMMKIFGKVSKYNGTSVELNSDSIDDDCEQTCFDEPDCILAFFNEKDYCMLVDFNSTVTLEVVETNREDGLFVSFKTSLPNETCPAYDYIFPVVKNMGEDDISWTKTGTTWNFIKCVGNWKMFQRSDPRIIVCMQVFIMGKGIAKSEGKDYCRSLGTNMTAVASEQESQWILGRFKTLYPKPAIWDSVWIDGVRNCTGESNVKCRNFDWSDGYTEGLNALVDTNACLSVIYQSSYEHCLSVSPQRTTCTINDISCDRKDKADLGVVCGYRME